MSDLISRQAAIKAVNTALFPKINTANDAEKALRNLPSAQTEITLESAIDYLHSIGWMQEHDRIMTESAPVVRAHWKDAVQGCHDSPHVICCACGEYFWEYFKTFRYCPNCGAKMDEVSE